MDIDLETEIEDLERELQLLDQQIQDHESKRKRLSLDDSPVKRPRVDPDQTFPLLLLPPEMLSYVFRWCDPESAVLLAICCSHCLEIANFSVCYCF
jgi:hypothetical protein